MGWLAGNYKVVMHVDIPLPASRSAVESPHRGGGMLLLSAVIAALGSLLFGLTPP